MGTRHLITFGVAVTLTVGCFAILGVDLLEDTFRTNVLINALLVSSGTAWIIWSIQQQYDTMRAEAARAERRARAQEAVRHLHAVD